MTLPTHAVTGLLIGTLTGHPIMGLVAGCFPDADHLYSYMKHGYLKNWTSFYKNAFGEHDVYGDQRNILHNVLIATAICFTVFIFWEAVAFTIALAYASHMVLDALDKSDYYPLYPWKGINIKGFIDFYSWQEGLVFFAITLALIGIKFF